MIAWCASGDGEGLRAIHARICRDQEHPVGSPLRCVLPLYEQATSLLKQGIWGICAAEKPSIQARQAEQAPRPAMQKHPVEQSPRSHRRGAVPLMAAWSVADGLVSGQCHKRKRKVSFRSF
jgi:hypothetical protein